LRVLEEGEIYRIGETSPRTVSFKLVSATNRNLRDEVAEGRFRMDLFYRVSVTSIRIPALMERKPDIPLLVAHFLGLLSEKYAAQPKRFRTEVLDAFEAYAWPGNVRELRNVVESMFLMAQGDAIGLEDLPPEIGSVEVPPRTAEKMAEVPVLGKLEDLELALIRKTIEQDGGNLTLVAKHLGIAKSTLYLKLKRYGLS